MSNYHETPTEPKILFAGNLSRVIENVWNRVLLDIEKAHAIEEISENVSLRVAMCQVQNALYNASEALNRASAIARREKL